MRNGRACRRAQARSARAAATLLFGPRSARGQALHQQEIARMLPTRRGGVRLGQAYGGAALDARRRRTGRLGHGDRRLGSAADGIRHPHRAHRQRPCRGRLRRVRHRHRHLHDHGAGDRRHARSAARQCHGQARRLDAAAGASCGRLVDRGVGRECHRQDGRGGTQRAVAASQEAAEFRARLRQARRHRARRTARSSARQRRSGPFRSRMP